MYFVYYGVAAHGVPSIWFKVQPVKEALTRFIEREMTAMKVGRILALGVLF